MRMLNTPEIPRASLKFQSLLRIFPFLLLSVFMVVLPSSFLMAQNNIRITGRIVTESGLAIAKASLLVKGLASRSYQ